MLPRFSPLSALILLHFHLLLWAFNLQQLKFHLSVLGVPDFERLGGVQLLVSDLAFNGTIVQFEAHPIRWGREWRAT